MSACPLCASERLDPLLDIAQVPVQIGVAWSTRQEARDAATGNVRLVLCCSCGLVINDGFEAERVRYAPGYDVSLTHSATYRAYLQREARVLVDVYGVRHSRVVEVGCGDGYFLRLVCQLGVNNGDGFDPSLRAAQSVTVGAGHVRLHPQEFRPDSQEFPPALVISRSVLELMPDPAGFLRALTAIADPAAARTLVYLEVPNARWLFGNHMAWNIHYEHRSYFTADVLEYACASQGMRVLECAPCYDDGQYLRLLAVIGGAQDAEPSHAGSRNAGLVHGFADAYRQLRAEWIARLTSLRMDGLRTVLWGAGGRGTSFLTAVDPHARLVDFAIDANPARHGAFLPLTGHPVRPPSALRCAGCDVLLVSNATYEAEITAAARNEGFEGEVLTL